MYYTIVLVIAVILLIVALVFVGYMLNTRGRNTTFPEYQSVCPDFWTLDGSGCRPPPGGRNTPSPDKFAGTPPSIQHDGVQVNTATKKVVSLNTSSEFWANLCSKSDWAKTNGIFWDGVSNTNQCS